MNTSTSSSQATPITSYVLEDKSQPLVNNTNPASLNAVLLTHHLDVAPDDTSCNAHMTREVAHFVGTILTPKQVLAILRVLKAVTLCFIVLTILANGMYIVFVEILADAQVRHMAGGIRDFVIRWYGLAMSFIALAIEMDYNKVVKRFAGLKAFIPRALLYVFIAVITASHPRYDITTTVVAASSSSSGYQDNYNNANGDDNYNNNNNNGNANDDNYNNNNNGYYNNNNNGNNGNYNDDYYQQQQSNTYDLTYEVKPEIPASAVGFQMVSSFVLGCCGLTYLICGLLCLDRFTAYAFISTKDPRVTTAIPPSSIAPSSYGGDPNNNNNNGNGGNGGSVGGMGHGTHGMSTTMMMMPTPMPPPQQQQQQQIPQAFATQIQTPPSPQHYVPQYQNQNQQQQNQQQYQQPHYATQQQALQPQHQLQQQQQIHPSLLPTVE